MKTLQKMTVRFRVINTLMLTLESLGSTRGSQSQLKWAFKSTPGHISDLEMRPGVDAPCVPGVDAPFCLKNVCLFNLLYCLTCFISSFSQNSVIRPVMLDGETWRGSSRRTDGEENGLHRREGTSAPWQDQDQLSYISA